MIKIKVSFFIIYTLLLVGCSYVTDVNYRNVNLDSEFNFSLSEAVNNLQQKDFYQVNHDVYEGLDIYSFVQYLPEGLYSINLYAIEDHLYLIAVNRFVPSGYRHRRTSSVQLTNHLLMPLNLKNIQYDLSWLPCSDDNDFLQYDFICRNNYVIKHDGYVLNDGEWKTEGYDYLSVIIIQPITLNNTP